MSWNPNAGQDPNQAGQYGGGYPPQQPNPNDPYSGQQYGQYGQQGAAPQPQYDPNSGQPYGQPGAAPQYDPNSGQQYGQYGQQPGYGQQQQQYGYQPPYGAQMGGADASAGAAASGPTSMGMQANVAAGLSYVFVWVSGLIIFFTEKTNQFVRFNALQSILFFGGLTGLRILLSIIDAFGVPFLGFITGILWLLIGLAGFVGWIVLMINAFQGKYFKLPVVGDYAERYIKTGKFQ